MSNLTILFAKSLSQTTGMVKEWKLDPQRYTVRFGMVTMITSMSCGAKNQTVRRRNRMGKDS